MSMTREEALDFAEISLELNSDCPDSSTYQFAQFVIGDIKRNEELEEENKRQKEIIAELRTRLEIETPSPWISNINNEE